MEKKIDELHESLKEKIDQAADLAKIESLRVELLGKKGPLTALMQELKHVSQEQKPLFGKKVNDLKQAIQQAIEDKKTLLTKKALNEQFAKETVDVTLPGTESHFGKEHPVNQFMHEIIDIFRTMGFSVQSGPEIDSDFYNFEGLNFPPDHPAREMQDTFYITDDVLLRTHTSNIQVRYMQTHKPPFRIIAPGKVYRNEDVNVRSHVLFHQVDGFYVDEKVSMADLMETLKLFFVKLFGKDVTARFRPSYFPFVEPGIEADIGCLLCSSKGCRICKDSGWLEVLGAGMIHPNVLKTANIDPDKYSGFAWGLGVERLLMILRGVDDIRLFWENDERFLKQFA